MSDELSLVDRESRRSQTPCRSVDREASILDTVSYFAIGFVFVGVIFSAIGFLYPRDLTRDPGASAAQNEQTEKEYIQLTEALNAIIITGMILTGLGGLLLSAIFTNTVVCHECHSDGEERIATSRQMTSQRASSTNGRPSGTSSGNGNTSTDYGTVSHASPAVEH